MLSKLTQFSEFSMIILTFIHGSEINVKFFDIYLARMDEMFMLQAPIRCCAHHGGGGCHVDGQTVAFALLRFASIL
jgi:hypothetical protein